MNFRPYILRLRPFVTLSLCIFVPLLFSGCARLRPPSAPLAPVSTTGTVVVAGTQYAYSTGERVGYNTVEVYLENQSARPVTFVSASLSGSELPRPDLLSLPKNLTQISLDVDGEDLPLLKPGLPPDSEITWWQFYPEPTIPAGGSAVCQINLRQLPTFQRDMQLRDTVGKTIDVKLPRFRQPKEIIMAVTWSLDYGKMFIQYRTGGLALEKVFINRMPVKNKKILRGGESAIPEVVEFAPPLTITRGMPVYIELTFSGGRARRALIRAASGIVLSAPMPPRQLKKIAEECGLDKDPAIDWLPFDVACADLKNSFVTRICG